MEAVGKRAVAMMALIALHLLFLSAHAGVEGSAPPEEGEEEFQSNQIGGECSKHDLALHQAATTPPPSGIPTYIGSGVEGSAPPEEGGEEFQSNWIGGECSKHDLALHQAATTPLPSGIPTYTVSIVNVCITGCSISDVHLACGWFSTARTINPAIFRRLSYNDCLVNDGKPIPAGGSVSFQYAQTYPYTLHVSSATCNP